MVGAALAPAGPTWRFVFVWCRRDFRKCRHTHSLSSPAPDFVFLIYVLVYPAWGLIKPARSTRDGSITQQPAKMSFGEILDLTAAVFYIYIMCLYVPGVFLCVCVCLFVLCVLFVVMFVHLLLLLVLLLASASALFSSVSTGPPFYFPYVRTYVHTHHALFFFVLFYKIMKYVSCESDWLNSWYSTWQAALYVSSIPHFLQIVW